MVGFEVSHDSIQTMRGAFAANSVITSGIAGLIGLEMAGVVSLTLHPIHRMMLYSSH